MFHSGDLHHAATPLRRLDDPQPQLSPNPHAHSSLKSESEHYVAENKHLLVLSANFGLISFAARANISHKCAQITTQSCKWWLLQH